LIDNFTPVEADILYYWQKISLAFSKTRAILDKEWYEETNIKKGTTGI